jgi:hypothetical protein
MTMNLGYYGKIEGFWGISSNFLRKLIDESLCHLTRRRTRMVSKNWSMLFPVQCFYGEWAREEVNSRNTNFHKGRHGVSGNRWANFWARNLTCSVARKMAQIWRFCDQGLGRCRYSKRGMQIVTFDHSPRSGAWPESAKKWLQGPPLGSSTIIISQNLILGGSIFIFP